MSRNLSFTHANFVATALAPDADRYNTDPATDIFNSGLYDHCVFVLQEGAGGTGTATLTVEECTDNAGTGATAVPFRYRLGTGAALTAIAATGYLTIAGANKDVIVEINADELSDGSKWVRLQITETVDSPVDASVLFIGSNARYAGATMPAAT